MFKCRKGFTLIELIVVMAVFITVIIITTDAFKTILTQMTKITKSEESNIEGIVGLEMFRHSIQQAGFGLPYSYLSSISYLEAGYAPANNYNDAPSGVPRAVVARDNIAAVAGPSGSEATNILGGTDYLVIKGSTLGLNDASQKWTYMPYDAANPLPRIWPSENLTNSDRVIVIRRTFTESTYTNELIFNTADPTIYWAQFDSTGFADTAFWPTLPEETYFIYGIKSGDPLGMPFNRADFFVARPTDDKRIPAACAPGTGILYKAVVNHDSTNPGGNLTYIPLLDCVADMQVVLGWDVDDGQGNEGQDGLVETYSTPLNSSSTITDITTSSAVAIATIANRVITAMGDAEKLRNSLKVVKVYILAQVGRRDSNYISPTTFAMSDPTYDVSTSPKILSADQLNYHWKVYRLVIRPKNLISNQ